MGTVLSPSKLWAFEGWHEALRSQQTSLQWDVLLAYVHAPPWLHRWSRGLPFGPGHRVRLRRPEDEDGAARVIWSCWERWERYSMLFTLDLDVDLEPRYLQRLHDVGAPWATGMGPAYAPFAAALFRRMGGDAQPLWVSASWRRQKPVMVTI